MYKIMIIDDEPIERMAISYVVKNSELPVMIVGEAADGLDAVKMCFDLNPDIVLLDIKMPCMDGLEAASEMLTLGLEGVIIFSTAYDEFEYAQKAIKLGAFDYILKPVRPEEVVKVIKRAIKELENRKRSQCRKMEEQKNLIKPYLESSLVFNLISGNFNLDELKKLAEFLEIDNFGQIALVIGVNSRNDNNDGYHNQLTRLQETKQKVLNIIKNEEKSIFGSVLMTSMGIDKVVVLVSVKEGNNDADIEHLVRDWANTIREKFLQADLGSITIGIGKSIKELDQIRESYLQAKKAFKIGSLLLEGNQLLHINDIESERYSPCCYEKETIVHGHIYNKEWEPLKRGFKEWFKDVVKSGEPIYIKKTRIIEMVIIISRAAIDEGAKREKVFDSLINFSNSMNLNHCLIDMLDYSVFVIEQFEHLVRECHKTYSEKIIFKAKEYIEKHYCTDFSMNDVAKAVSLSPHYFSRLFKRETGLTFLEFLTQKRIDRAKQLLRDPGLTINEVAQSVGYSEACYFSRVFKKSENISPSEYREKFFKSPGIISTVNL